MPSYITRPTSLTVAGGTVGSAGPGATVAARLQSEDGDTSYAHALSGSSHTWIAPLSDPSIPGNQVPTGLYVFALVQRVAGVADNANTLYPFYLGIDQGTDATAQLKRAEFHGIFNADYVWVRAIYYRHADGTPWTAASINAARARMVTGTTRRISALRADFYTFTMGTATVTGPSGTIAARQPTVGVAYAGGNARSRTTVLLFTPAQYGVGGFNPDTSPHEYSFAQSGASPSVRLPEKLPNGTYRIYGYVQDSGLRTVRTTNFTTITVNDPVVVPTLPTDAIAAGQVVTTPFPALVANIAAQPGGATSRLHFQIASDAGVTTDLRNLYTAEGNTTTRKLTVAVGTALEQGGWFYRVRAVDEFGTASAWTATRAFSVQHAPTTRNYTPANGAALIDNGAWAAIGGAVLAGSAGRFDVDPGTGDFAAPGGEFTVIACVKVGAWASGRRVLASYGQSTATSWRFGLNASGALFLEVSNNGTTINTFTSSVLMTGVDVAHHVFVAATFVPDDGSGNCAVRFWRAAAFAAQANETAWTQVGSAQVGSGVVTPYVPASSTVLRLGAASSANADSALNTTIHAAALLAGVGPSQTPGGSTVFRFETSNDLATGGSGAKTSVSGHVVTPFSGASFAARVATTNVLWFEFRDPWAGDTMSAKEIRVFDDSLLPGAVIANTGVIGPDDLYPIALTRVWRYHALSWSVRVADSGGVWSAWSAPQSFRTALRPTITLVDPTDGGDALSPKPVIDWSLNTVDGSTQTAFQLTIRRASDNSLVYTTPTIVTDVTQHEVPTPVLLLDVDYQLTLVVSSSLGFTVTEQFTFGTDYDMPGAPTLIVSAPDYSAHPAVDLDWSATEPDGDFISWLVVRRQVGEATWTVLAEIADPTERHFLDWAAPSGVPLEYAILHRALRFGNAADGSSEPVGFTGAAHTYFLVVPAQPDLSVKLWHVSGDNFSDEWEEEVHNVIGRGRRHERGTRYGKSGTLKLKLNDRPGATARQQRMAIEALREQRGLAIYLRNPFGDVWPVALVGYDVDRVAGTGIHEATEISLEYEEVSG